MNKPKFLQSPHLEKCGVLGLEVLHSAPEGGELPVEVVLPCQAEQHQVCHSEGRTRVTLTIVFITKPRMIMSWWLERTSSRMSLLICL